MNNSKECEERVMITKEQFETIASLFKNIPPIEQVNYYFDDSSLSLTKNHMVLRIRKFKIGGELTLKVKCLDGDMEYNQELTDELIKEYLANKSIRINDEFNKFINIPLGKLHFVGSMSTTRFEKRIDDYLLVLDKNINCDIIDYNLEVEAPSKQRAKEILKEYCSQYSIDNQKDYISKSRRAIYYYLSKNKIN